MSDNDASVDPAPDRNPCHRRGSQNENPTGPGVPPRAKAVDSSDVIDIAGTIDCSQSDLPVSSIVTTNSDLGCQSLDTEATLQLEEESGLAGIVLVPSIESMTCESHEIPLGELKLVGRGRTSQVRIAMDKWMSREHFSIECRRDHVLLIDLNSSNGTMINGRRISNAKVCDGDKISAGTTEFNVRFLDGRSTKR